MNRTRIIYHDNLEDLIAFFNGRRILSLRDVARYTGRGSRWCKKTYNIDPKKGISIPTLARKLSGGTFQ